MGILLAAFSWLFCSVSIFVMYSYDDDVTVGEMRDELMVCECVLVITGESVIQILYHIIKFLDFLQFC